MRVLTALLLTWVLVPAAQAATWTKPSVLLRGDDQALRSTAILPDGRVRAATVDKGITFGLQDGPPFGPPLLTRRDPQFVSALASAADGGGVAVGTAGVFAFDAAGVAQPPLAIADVGEQPAVAISPAGTAMAAWVAKAGDDY